MLTALLFASIVIAPAAYVWWSTRDLRNIHLAVGNNNTALATTTFLRLLEEAEHTMLVSDDANDMEESIYNNTDVIQATLQRLEDRKELHLYCLFFSPDYERTKFVEALTEHQQVSIKRVEPRRDIHVKIADNGKLGYLTSHPIGASDRRYRFYDCSGAPESVRQEIFGHHLGTMQAYFPELESRGA